MLTVEKQRGFTLIEVVIAVAVTSFLMAVVFGVFSSTSRARKKAEEASGRIHEVRVLYDRLSRELRGCNWAQDGDAVAFTATAEDHRFKELVFTTTAASGQGQAQIDGTRVRYVLEQDNGDLFTLRRSTSDASDTEDEEAKKYEMLADIVDMELRFYANDAWFEKWNAEDEKTLPGLIEITLEIQAGESEQSFSTTVDIPMSGG